MNVISSLIFNFINLLLKVVKRRLERMNKYTLQLKNTFETVDTIVALSRLIVSVILGWIDI